MCTRSKPLPNFKCPCTYTPVKNCKNYPFELPGNSLPSTQCARGAGCYGAADLPPQSKPLVPANTYVEETVGGKTYRYLPNRNMCGAPCSVLVPGWIGRLDQGNGLIGEGPTSGYVFYDAY